MSTEQQSSPTIEIVGVRNYGPASESIPELGTPDPVASDVSPEATPELPKADPTPNPEVDVNNVAPTTPVSEPTTSAVTSIPTPEKNIDGYSQFGIDESSKEDFDKMLNAWKSGKIDEFVQVKNTNYDSMSPEDLVKLDLKINNPKASPRQLELLHKQVLESYKINDIDEETSNDGKELYNLQAEKIRDVFKAKQSEYTLPEYKAPEQPATVDYAALERETMEMVKNDPAYTSFATNRIVQLGSGDDVYNYEVPATMDIPSALASGNWIQSKLTDADGKFNMQKAIKAFNYINDPDKLESDLIKHGKSLGSKQEFSDQINPRPNVVAAPPESESAIKIIGVRNR